MGLNSKEAVVNAFHYALGVGKKATGVDSYQRWRKHSQTFGENSPLRNERRYGLISGALQVAIPTYVDTIANSTVAQERNNGRFPAKELLQGLPLPITELMYYATTLLPMAISHPIETAVIKTAINIGVPIASDLYYGGLDLAAKGVNRLRSHLPPSPAMLTV